MSSPELMTVAEVSALTGEPEGELLTWRSLGKGPQSFRLAGRTYYLRADVEAWVANREAS